MQIVLIVLVGWWELNRSVLKWSAVSRWFSLIKLLLLAGNFWLGYKSRYFLPQTWSLYFQVIVLYRDKSLYIWDIANIHRVGKYRSYLFHSACICAIEVSIAASWIQFSLLFFVTLACVYTFMLSLSFLSTYLQRTDGKSEFFLYFIIPYRCIQSNF